MKPFLNARQARDLVDYLNLEIENLELNSAERIQVLEYLLHQILNKNSNADEKQAAAKEKDETIDIVNRIKADLHKRQQQDEKFANQLPERLKGLLYDEETSIGRNITELAKGDANAAYLKMARTMLPVGDEFNAYSFTDGEKANIKAQKLKIKLLSELNWSNDNACKAILGFMQQLVLAELLKAKFEHEKHPVQLDNVQIKATDQNHREVHIAKEIVKYDRGLQLIEKEKAAKKASPSQPASAAAQVAPAAPAPSVNVALDQKNKTILPPAPIGVLGSFIQVASEVLFSKPNADADATACTAVRCLTRSATAPFDRIEIAFKLGAKQRIASQRELTKLFLNRNHLSALIDDENHMLPRATINEDSKEEVLEFSLVPPYILNKSKGDTLSYYDAVIAKLAIGPDKKQQLKGLIRAWINHPLVDLKPAIPADYTLLQRVQHILHCADVYKQRADAKANDENTANANHLYRMAANLLLLKPAGRWSAADFSAQNLLVKEIEHHTVERRVITVRLILRSAREYILRADRLIQAGQPQAAKELLEYLIKVDGLLYNSYIKLFKRESGKLLAGEISDQYYKPGMDISLHIAATQFDVRQMTIAFNILESIIECYEKLGIKPGHPDRSLSDRNLPDRSLFDEHYADFSEHLKILRSDRINAVDVDAKQVAKPAVNTQARTLGECIAQLNQSEFLSLATAIITRTIEQHVVIKEMARQPKVELQLTDDAAQLELKAVPPPKPDVEAKVEKNAADNKVDMAPRPAVLTVNSHNPAILDKYSAPAATLITEIIFSGFNNGDLKNSVQAIQKLIQNNPALQKIKFAKSKFNFAIINQINDIIALAQQHPQLQEIDFDFAEVQDQITREYITNESPKLNGRHGRLVTFSKNGLSVNFKDDTRLLNVRGKDGYTPLHKIAAMTVSANLGKFLLQDCDAQFNVRDEHHALPCDYAMTTSVAKSFSVDANVHVDLQVQKVVWQAGEKPLTYTLLPQIGKDEKVPANTKDIDVYFELNANYCIDENRDSTRIVKLINTLIAADILGRDSAIKFENHFFSREDDFIPAANAGRGIKDASAMGFDNFANNNAFLHLNVPYTPENLQKVQAVLAQLQIPIQPLNLAQEIIRAVNEYNIPRLSILLEHNSRQKNPVDLNSLRNTPPADTKCSHLLLCLDEKFDLKKLSLLNSIVIQGSNARTRPIVDLLLQYGANPNTVYKPHANGYEVIQPSALACCGDEDEKHLNTENKHMPHLDMFKHLLGHVKPQEENDQKQEPAAIKRYYVDVDPVHFYGGHQTHLSFILLNTVPANSNMHKFNELVKQPSYDLKIQEQSDMGPKRPFWKRGFTILDSELMWVYNDPKWSIHGPTVEAAEILLQRARDEGVLNAKQQAFISHIIANLDGGKLKASEIARCKTELPQDIEADIALKRHELNYKYRIINEISFRRANRNKPEFLSAASKAVFVNRKKEQTEEFASDIDKIVAAANSIIQAAQPGVDEKKPNLETIVAAERASKLEIARIMNELQKEETEKRQQAEAATKMNQKGGELLRASIELRKTNAVSSKQLLEQVRTANTIVATIIESVKKLAAAGDEKALSQNIQANLQLLTEMQTAAKKEAESAAAAAQKLTAEITAMSKDGALLIDVWKDAVDIEDGMLLWTYDLSHINEAASKKVTERIKKMRDLFASCLPAGAVQPAFAPNEVQAPDAAQVAQPPQAGGNGQNVPALPAPPLPSFAKYWRMSDEKLLDLKLVAVTLVDVEKFNSVVANRTTFPAFSKPQALANALFEFDMLLRTASSDDEDAKKDPIQAFAKHVVNTLHTHTQVAGWKHFEEYVADPEAYITKLTRRAKLPGADAVPVPPSTRAIDQLEGVGDKLIKRLIQRVDDCVTKVQQKGLPFNPRVALLVLVADRAWMDETFNYMKESEEKVTDLLKKNSPRFGVFRDLQRRGVQWPHNAQIRRDVEAAGFAFRPMMVKRDRCVCDTCGVEISGLRPWHNPWLLHNFDRHDSAFYERAMRSAPAFASNFTQPLSAEIRELDQARRGIPATQAEYDIAKDNFEIARAISYQRAISGFVLSTLNFQQDLEIAKAILADKTKIALDLSNAADAARKAVEVADAAKKAAAPDDIKQKNDALLTAQAAAEQAKKAADVAVADQRTAQENVSKAENNYTQALAQHAKDTAGQADEKRGETHQHYIKAVNLSLKHLNGSAEKRVIALNGFIQLMEQSPSTHDMLNKSQLKSILQAVNKFHYDYYVVQALMNILAGIQIKELDVDAQAVVEKNKVKPVILSLREKINRLPPAHVPAPIPAAQQPVPPSMPLPPLKPVVAQPGASDLPAPQPAALPAPNVAVLPMSFNPFAKFWKLEEKEEKLDLQPIALPLNDVKPEIEFKALFKAFAKPQPLSNMLFEIDNFLRSAVLGADNDPTKDQHQGLAKHVVSALATQTQLAGWKHVQDYIVDPKAYMEKLKAVRNPDLPRGDAVPVPDPSRSIDQLEVDGEKLIRRFVQRVDQYRTIAQQKGLPFHPRVALQYLAADANWMEETGTFTKKAEAKVTDLLKRNAQRFAAFRDLQKRGVQWPHSPRLRKDIESAGFVFRPMMVKRDRCVCDTCGVEIAGWRPWHNPWLMHNLSRHAPDFHDRVQRFGQSFASFTQEFSAEVIALEQAEIKLKNIAPGAVNYAAAQSEYNIANDTFEIARAISYRRAISGFVLPTVNSQQDLEVAKAILADKTKIALDSSNAADAARKAVEAADAAKKAAVAPDDIKQKNAELLTAQAAAEQANVVSAIAAADQKAAQGNVGIAQTNYQKILEAHANNSADHADAKLGEMHQQYIKAVNVNLKHLNRTAEGRAIALNGFLRDMEQSPGTRDMLNKSKMKPILQAVNRFHYDYYAVQALLCIVEGIQVKELNADAQAVIAKNKLKPNAALQGQMNLLQPQNHAVVQPNAVNYYVPPQPSAADLRQLGVSMRERAEKRREEVRRQKSEAAAKAAAPQPAAPQPVAVAVANSNPVLNGNAPAAAPAPAAANAENANAEGLRRCNPTPSAAPA